MRIIILVFASIFTLAAHAQTPVVGTLAPLHVTNDSIGHQKNWTVSMYSGIAAGVGFFNNGRTAFLPAAIGIQLNRRLNNNLYAFAGVSAAPAFFYTGSVFNNATYNNFMTTPGFNTSQWGLNTGIHAGLMYVNDAKTFSISGSIGVSNNSYYPYRQGALKQQRVVEKQ